MNGRLRIFRFVFVLAVLGIVYWQRGHFPGVFDSPKASQAAAVSPIRETGAPAAQVRGYDRFENARLVERDSNDGDSFTVRAGGREFELRLYFVDAPETYLSNRYADQRRRVEEQARAMGGITPEEAIEVGKRAKAFTKQQLGARNFTVYTYWEQVFDSNRYYGFVELPDGGDLATRLVAEGLARIHTKGPGSKERPVPTPRGESFFEARDMLRTHEQEARQAKRGAWGY